MEINYPHSIHRALLGPSAIHCVSPDSRWWEMRHVLKNGIKSRVPTESQKWGYFPYPFFQECAALPWDWNNWLRREEGIKHRICSNPCKLANNQGNFLYPIRLSISEAFKHSLCKSQQFLRHNVYKLHCRKRVKLSLYETGTSQM